MNQNSNSKPKPSPTPTPTEEQREAAREKEKVDKHIALKTFVSKNFEGWSLNGVSSEFIECEPEAPCHLDLVKGSEHKVVSVMMKEFQREDGTSYWLVFEARPFDLAIHKLKEIREKERDVTLENLTFENCESVIEAEREIEVDHPEYDPMG